jgi:hypothetical protein
MTGTPPAASARRRASRAGPAAVLRRPRLGHGIAAVGHETVTVASKFSRLRPIAHLRAG